MKRSVIFLSFLLSACSFKSAENIGVEQSNSSVNVLELKTDPTLDSDGDGILNKAESDKGTNPFVANLPEVNFQFMRDFALNFNSNNERVVIDSVKDIKMKNFEYLVGDLTIAEISRKSTAKFARFDGVLSGTYNQVDLTRISYPKISTQFIASLVPQTKSLNPTNISVTFTNTLKLERNRGFQSISNPVFNFYYRNHETGEYELLSQKKIEKNFYEEVTEKIEITIDNLPSKLLEENLYKNGEFILAEIEDFEIPSLKISYKNLLAKVKEKCLPVTTVSPIETRVSYVSLNEYHNRLGEFLKSLYGSNFKIENNKLVQVSGLSNNLSGFKFLYELKGQTKIGKWFILVNKEISDDIFQYQFNFGDNIVLNYMTGDDLANQVISNESKFLDSIASELNTKDFEIGEVGLNSEIFLELSPRKLQSKNVEQLSWGYSDSGGNAHWVYRYLNNAESSFSLTSEQFLRRFTLVLNNKELNLFDLVKNKLASVVIKIQIF